MIVGGYTLHLYCTSPGCEGVVHGRPVFAEFTGPETGGQARAEARRAGWHLDLTSQTATCPRCVRGKSR